jgi:hypothetical protein
MVIDARRMRRKQRPITERRPFDRTRSTRDQCGSNGAIRCYCFIASVTQRYHACGEVGDTYCNADRG